MPEHKRWFPNIFSAVEGIQRSTWRGPGRICDLAQAAWILCSQKSGSVWAYLGRQKTQCGLFLLSASLDIGLVLNFPSSCFFFCERMSPGHASALSSCSRNRYLKHEVPRAGFWFLDESSSWEIWICHTSLSISVHSCTCHIFQDYFRLFFIVWQEPYSANQWATPPLEGIMIYLVPRLFQHLLIPSREGALKRFRLYLQKLYGESL